MDLRSVLTPSLRRVDHFCILPSTTSSDPDYTALTIAHLTATSEIRTRRSSPYNNIEALSRTRQGQHILVRPECDSSRARLPIHNHHPTQRDRSALSRSVDDVDIALCCTTSEGGREGDVLAADGERGLDALCTNYLSAHPRRQRQWMKWYARSQRPLEMLMVSPLIAGVIEKRTLPDWPVVDVGAPWHFWIVPAMPPQIWSRATFEVWKSRALRTAMSARAHGFHECAGYSRLRRALHVGDRLLAHLQRRGKRAEEEHGERVENGSELHLELLGKTRESE